MIKNKEIYNIEKFTINVSSVLIFDIINKIPILSGYIYLWTYKSLPLSI